MSGQQPGLSFSHVGIYVGAIEAAADFYANVLDFTVTDRGSLATPDGGSVSLVFLSRDPDEHHQIVLVSGRPDSATFSTINQISLRADSLATLRRYHQRLRSAEAQAIACVSHGNAVSLYAQDPEGNRIELFWDTPWYVPQPMRVPVDIDTPDEELLAAIEVQVRAQPGFKPRAVWRAETAQLMGLS